MLRRDDDPGRLKFALSRFENSIVLTAVLMDRSNRSTGECALLNAQSIATDRGEAFAEGIRSLLRREDSSPTVAVRVIVGTSDEDDNEDEIAAAILVEGVWHPVADVFVEGAPGRRVWQHGREPIQPSVPPDRVARLTSSFGTQAWQRLRRSSVAVIGAGGTGSVAIPTLARAGVGRLVIVDDDRISASNLERTHASFPEHVDKRTLKVELARDHVRSIDPETELVALNGRLPQREIVEEVASCDMVIGCTDSHTSRMAVADMARRFLVPALDCGGLIEGAHGNVTGQIVQLVRFGTDDPCPRCRGMIDPVRIAQELMSVEERERLATEHPNDTPPEAHEVPQIDTVGYITTVSGTLAAGYAIGLLTGRFAPPFERMQMNLVAPLLGVTDRPQDFSPNCDCRRARGLGDLGADYAPFAVPPHWPSVRPITS